MFRCKLKRGAHINAEWRYMRRAWVPVITVCQTRYLERVKTYTPPDEPEEETPEEETEEESLDIQIDLSNYYNFEGIVPDGTLFEIGLEGE